MIKLALLLFASVTVSGLVAPMPAFIWTPKQDVLVSPALEYTTSLSSSSVSSLVSFLSYPSASVPVEFSDLVNSKISEPEVVVVFVHPKLHTSQVTQFGDAFSRSDSAGAFDHLKTLIDDNPSLSLPYTFKTAQSLLEELTSLEHVHVVDAEDAPAFLHGNPRMFSDKHTDVVVVKFGDIRVSGDALREKLTRDDQIVGQVSRTLSERTNDNYVGILTANNPGTSPARKAIEISQQELFESQLKSMSKAYSSSNDPVKSSPAVISAVLVLLLLFTITFVGISGLMALKTPDQFEADGGALSAH